MTMYTSYSTTPESVQITARQPVFDFEDTPSVWLSDPIKTHFMNALSILIPYSEKTVNEVMRKNSHRIQDSKLRQDIQGLIKQEGAHARMHRHTNTLLADAGFKKVVFFERLQKQLMSTLRRVSTDAFEMAMPAAFEHFTAAISRDFLTHPYYWYGNKESAAIEFSKWHALEELEHQAVCYDVFNSLYKNKYRLSIHLSLIHISEPTRPY